MSLLEQLLSKPGPADPHAPSRRGTAESLWGPLTSYVLDSPTAPSSASTVPSSPRSVYSSAPSMSERSFTSVTSATSVSSAGTVSQFSTGGKLEDGGRSTFGSPPPTSAAGLGSPLSALSARAMGSSVAAGLKQQKEGTPEDVKPKLGQAVRPPEAQLKRPSDPRTRGANAARYSTTPSTAASPGPPQHAAPHLMAARSTASQQATPYLMTTRHTAPHLNPSQNAPALQLPSKYNRRSSVGDEAPPSQYSVSSSSSQQPYRRYSSNSGSGRSQNYGGRGPRMFQPRIPPNRTIAPREDFTRDNREIIKECQSAARDLERAWGAGGSHGEKHVKLFDKKFSELTTRIMDTKLEGKMDSETVDIVLDACAAMLDLENVPHWDHVGDIQTIRGFLRPEGYWNDWPEEDDEDEEMP